MKGITLFGLGQRGSRRVLVGAVSAGALLLLGLGGSAPAPTHAPPHAPSPHAAPTAHPTPASPPHVAPVHAPARTAATPRMLENGALFSFADLVERVSPAVV